LLSAAKQSGLKEKALNLLAGKPMSRRELERKLDAWEATESEKAAICDRLEELGYLNDGQYAARVVRHYSAKGYGERKLRDELYRRGVPRELWDEALQEAESPEGAIDAFLRKKLDGRTPDRKELQKVSAALARRGYGWSDINEALERYAAQWEEA
jgi:regulatory protein